MQLRGTRRVVGAAAALVTVGGFIVGVPPAAAQSETSRYLVLARSAGDYAGLRAEAVTQGARVIREIPELQAIVVRATSGARDQLARSGRADGVVADRVRTIDTVDRFAPRLDAPGLRGARTGPAASAASADSTASAARTYRADPAFSYRGLLWDYRHMGLPEGWETTQGRAAVTVGVADTGVDFTHADLRSKVLKVVDLTADDDPHLCTDERGRIVTDRDLARRFGGPAKTDWNGHGSWIGGNIAAALNGTGTNGIAPKVGLVALKIAEWCGSAYDSSLLASFITGARMGLDVLSISFGGYEPPGPDGRALFRAYQRAVQFAKSRGTVIVNSAGNAHVQIGIDGRISSHGALTTPGTPRSSFVDLHGYYRLPGGPAGYVVVSATNRRTIGASAHCPPGTTGEEDLNATCKPRSDRHDPIGVGQKDQLTYYSNYGPRIDIAAPGGARKFNLPVADRGGTPGFPYTNDDLTNVWEAFSTTSNWAVQIPCFTFTRGSGFPQGQCYTSIQGTSMAAPHVSAALALTASAHPGMRHNVDRLVTRLLNQAVDRYNYTPALSATDKSPGDLFGGRCVTGYCHLGGPRIRNWQAYGAGLVNVHNP